MYFIMRTTVKPQGMSEQTLPVMDLILQSPVLMAILILVIAVFVLAILMRTPPAKPKEYPNAGSVILDSAAAALSYTDHVRMGNEAAGQYDFDTSLAHFQEALRIKGTEPALHFKIGRLFIQKADYKNAIVAFKNVLSLNPTQSEAHFELARIYQLQNDAEQVHQALNQVLAQEPNHEEALRFKVKVYAQNDQYQAALPIVKKLISISSNPVKYHNQLADFLVKLGHLDEALDTFEGLLELDPDNQVLYKSKIGQVYFDKGNYTKAIEYFKSVLQEQDLVGSGETLSTIRSQMAASLCNEGVKLFGAENYIDAIQRYQEALLYDSANADIHYNLSKAYVKTENSLSALKHFETGISLNPMDLSCYYELALLQDEKGMIKEAVATYEKVLELDPRNINAMFGLGTLHGVQGDLNQSIHFLSEAIRLNPAYVDAMYNLGVALERKKDFNKATQVYKRVLKLDKHHEKARSNLAHIQHLKLGSR